MTYLGEFSPFQAVVGNSHSGISINYGECLASPIHVLTISYFGGNSPPCSMVKILNDPTATPSGIYVTDCTSPVPNRLSAPGVATFINSDGSCRGGG
ncbi:MAG: hypothetical protein GTN50_08460 [Candidatus Latescibacteria bacterium]|nr:hypothetical protein [Candidatus Latescibacterota bacterium]